MGEDKDYIVHWIYTEKFTRTFWDGRKEQTKGGDNYGIEKGNILYNAWEDSLGPVF
jgi:hypothetical protein